jgi:hypothetical protein
MFTLIKNRNPLSDNEGFKQNIQAVPLWIRCARHFQSGDSSAAKTGRTELLCRRLFVPRIQNEARRNRIDEFFTGSSKIGTEARHRQIENTQQSAFERENQVGITRSTTQLTICRDEKRLGFKQGSHLTIRAIKNREGLRRIVATAKLKRSDGRQRLSRCTWGHYTKRQKSYAKEIGSLVGGCKGVVLGIIIWRKAWACRSWRSCRQRLGILRYYASGCLNDSSRAASIVAADAGVPFRTAQLFLAVTPNSEQRFTPNNGSGASVRLCLTRGRPRRPRKTAGSCVYHSSRSDDKKSPAPLCQGVRGNLDRTNLLPQDRRALEDEPHGVEPFPRKVTSQGSASIMEAGRPTRLPHRPFEILCKIAHS